MSLSADEILKNKSEKDTIISEYAKKAFFSNIGIDPTGIGYVVVLGWYDDFREEKVRELRKQGFRWHNQLKAWIGNIPAQGVLSIKVDFNTVITYGYDNCFHFIPTAKHEIECQYVKQNPPETGESCFFGKHGDRFHCKVKYEGSTTIRADSDFGDYEVLRFGDTEGHKFTWFQRCYSPETIKEFIKKNEVDEIELIGSVKNHKTLCGVCITEVMRCEIYANGKRLHDFATRKRGHVDSCKKHKEIVE